MRNFSLTANTQRSFTISNSARFMVFFMSAYNACNGIASFPYYGTGQCDGAVWVGGSAPSGITVNVATNNVLKLTTTGNTLAVFFIADGTVTG